MYIEYTVYAVKRIWRALGRKISRAFRKLAVIGRFVATGFHKVSFPGEEWSGHCHLRLSPIRNVSLRF